MNRSALWVGAGCLGCIGVPSLLAIGGAGGYLLATQRDASVAVVERVPEERIAVAPERDVRGDDEWETSSLRIREDARVLPLAPVVKELAVETAKPAPTPLAREIAVAKPTATPETIAKLASPISTPVAKELARLAAPVSTPAATELARMAQPISTPAPAAVKGRKDVANSAPIPKSTPRNFDEPAFKPAKPAKTPAVASAAGGGAPMETAEDVAVAALFGDAPGSSAPSAAAAPAPAASNPKLRTIKTRGGPVQVTLGNKIAIQGADKKAVLGTLEKVEGGWVAIRLGDGKVRMIAEGDVIDASEL